MILASSFERVDYGLPELPAPGLHALDVGHVGLAYLHEGDGIGELLADTQFGYDDFLVLLLGGHGLLPDVPRVGGCAQCGHNGSECGERG